MNRFDKEMCRRFMIENIDHLSAKQQKDFVRLFSIRSKMSPQEVIASVDNKLLRRAHRFIRTSIKK